MAQPCHNGMPEGCVTSCGNKIIMLRQGSGHSAVGSTCVQAQAASERGSQADVVHAAEQLQVG